MKFSLTITGRISSMFPKPFRRETEIENFSNHSIRWIAMIFDWIVRLTGVYGRYLSGAWIPLSLAKKAGKHK